MYGSVARGAPPAPPRRRPLFVPLLLLVAVPAVVYFAAQYNEQPDELVSFAPLPNIDGFSADPALATTNLNSPISSQQLAASASSASSAPAVAVAAVVPKRAVSQKKSIVEKKAHQEEVVSPKLAILQQHKKVAVKNAAAAAAAADKDTDNVKAILAAARAATKAEKEAEARYRLAAALPEKKEENAVADVVESNDAPKVLGEVANGMKLFATFPAATPNPCVGADISTFTYHCETYPPLPPNPAFPVTWLFAKNELNQQLFFATKVDGQLELFRPIAPLGIARQETMVDEEWWIVRADKSIAAGPWKVMERNQWQTVHAPGGSSSGGSSSAASASASSSATEGGSSASSSSSSSSEDAGGDAAAAKASSSSAAPNGVKEKATSNQQQLAAAATASDFLPIPSADLKSANKVAPKEAVAQKPSVNSVKAPVVAPIAAAVKNTINRVASAKQQSVQNLARKQQPKRAAAAAAAPTARGDSEEEDLGLKGDSVSLKIAKDTSALDQIDSPTVVKKKFRQPTHAEELVYLNAAPQQQQQQEQYVAVQPVVEYVESGPGGHQQVVEYVEGHPVEEEMAVPTQAQSSLTELQKLALAAAKAQKRADATLQKTKSIAAAAADNTPKISMAQEAADAAAKAQLARKNAAAAAALSDAWKKPEDDMTKANEQMAALANDLSSKNAEVLSSSTASRLIPDGVDPVLAKAEQRMKSIEKQLHSATADASKEEQLEQHAAHVRAQKFSSNKQQLSAVATQRLAAKSNVKGNTSNKNKVLLKQAKSLLSKLAAPKNNKALDQLELVSQQLDAIDHQISDSKSKAAEAIDDTVFNSIAPKGEKLQQQQQQQQPKQQQQLKVVSSKSSAHAKLMSSIYSQLEDLKKVIIGRMHSNQQQLSNVDDTALPPAINSQPPAAHRAAGFTSKDKAIAEAFLNGGALPKLSKKKSVTKVSPHAVVVVKKAAPKAATDDDSPIHLSFSDLSPPEELQMEEEEMEKAAHENIGAADAEAVPVKKAPVAAARRKESSAVSDDDELPILPM